MLSATDAYNAMQNDITRDGFARQSSDVASPLSARTEEAAFGRKYVLTAYSNATKCDRRWAMANVLHFFADTEQAYMLHQYNRHAKRFVDVNGEWKGAYGRIAMQQIRNCIDKLWIDRHSRRAIVSMGELPVDDDINRPACWSHLHFMYQGERLHMHAYQRSLSMAVMPYDAILLTNILRYVSWRLILDCGLLHWTIGSLHRIGPEELHCGPADTIILPATTLMSSLACMEWLLRPETATDSYVKATLLGGQG